MSGARKLTKQQRLFRNEVISSVIKKNLSMKMEHLREAVNKELRNRQLPPVLSVSSIYERKAKMLAGGNTKAEMKTGTKSLRLSANLVAALASSNVREFTITNDEGEAVSVRLEA